MLIIDYTWHPIYPQKSEEQLKWSCKLILSQSIANVVKSFCPFADVSNVYYYSVRI